MSEKMEKECEFFDRMLSDYHMSNPFHLVHVAIDDDTVNYCHLEDLQARCNEIFRFLLLRRRFDKLSSLVDTLECSRNGFRIYGHEFETLDQVEKSIQNKAFM
jgi:hypothetical protein